MNVAQCRNATDPGQAFRDQSRGSGMIRRRRGRITESLIGATRRP
jgi:hypothetical protein